MTKSSFSGPLIVYGVGNSGLGQTVGESNQDLGPSVFVQGTALLDMRSGYDPGQASSQGVKAWGPSIMVPVLDVAPATKTATAVAAAQVPVAGTPLTLVAATGAGITVGASVVNALTGATVTGLRAVGGAAGVVNFGGGGAVGLVNLYDPTLALARCLIFTSAGDDHLATAKVSGYDIYGFPMSQTVTLTNASTVSTTKAFKYISSIVPAGTLSGSNLSVGTTDTIGLPLRASRFAETTIFVNDALITASTGFTVADATNPATVLTGDTRGTYALQTAADGTKRTQIFQRVSVANLALGSVGLTGIQQI